MLIKGNPEAFKAYRDRKVKALARTAKEREARDKAKAAHNAAEAK